jgi:hypothetical protein
MFLVITPLKMVEVARNQLVELNIKSGRLLVTISLRI